MKPAHQLSMGPYSIEYWNGDKGKSVALRKSKKKENGEWENMTVWIPARELSSFCALLQCMQARVAKDQDETSEAPQEVPAGTPGTPPDGPPF